MATVCKFPIIENSDSIIIVKSNKYDDLDNNKKIILLNEKTLNIDGVESIYFYRFIKNGWNFIDVRGILTYNNVNFCFSFELNTECLIEDLKNRLANIIKIDIDYKKAEILKEKNIISNYINLSNLKNYVLFLRLFDIDEFENLIFNRSSSICNKTISIFNNSLDLTTIDFKIKFNIRINKIDFFIKKGNFSLGRFHRYYSSDSIFFTNMKFINHIYNYNHNTKDNLTMKFNILCYLLYKIGGENNLNSFLDDFEKKLIS